MIHNLIPVVLCGGVGSRLWPISTRDQPKQFFKFDEENSLLQHTILRLIDLNKKIKFKYIIFVTNESFRFQLLSQLKEIDLKIKFKLILEPFSKNTAPSLTLASLETQALKNAILFCLPSDHHIVRNNVFVDTICRAINKYNFRSITTFGIKPHESSTEYGYIKYSGSNFLKKVASFHEKPKLQKAKGYLKSGSYLWNSGMFLVSPILWIQSFEKINHNEFYRIKESYAHKTIDNLFIRPCSKLFKRLNGNSIDYEIIEKVFQIPLDLNVCKLNVGWSDFGSFKSIQNSKLFKKGLNVKKGIANFNDSKNNFVMNQTNKHLVLNGISDCLVIATENSILVSDINAKNNKNFQNPLKKNNSELTNIPVFRPWGNYILLINEKGFKVKKITINPLQSISLQKHNHRNEHWVVVQGEATVIREDVKLKLKANESIYIEKKQKHRLSNNTKKELIVIEVQTGNILREDDIMRYEDNYSRNLS